MSKIKLLHDVINDMRSLADSLESLASAMFNVDNNINPTPTVKVEQKPAVTHEQVRELAVKLSKTGKRDDVKALLNKYGTTNITSIKPEQLENFYDELKAMEEVTDIAEQ